MRTVVCFFAVAIGAFMPVSDAAPVENSISMKLHVFPMTEVRLLEGPFKDGQEINRKFLYSLDVEQLLYNFRVTAGLPAPGKALTGWEAPDCDVRGHFFGPHSC